MNMIMLGAYLERKPIVSIDSIIKALKKDAKNADKVYLASDPDREGEAIAWHLAYILGIDATDDCRIVFNEITKSAIQASFVCATMCCNVFIHQ